MKSGINNILFVSLIFLLVIPMTVSVKTGSDSGTIDFSSDNEILIGDAQCQEIWTSYWSDCIDGEQTYICYDENSCGTENIKPEDCGAVQECTEENNDGDDSGTGSSGTSSGSGSRSTSGNEIISTTSENSDSGSIEWVCDEWSECVNNSQTRICVDKEGKAETKTQTKYCATIQELGNETSEEKGIIKEAGSKILGNFIEAGRLANSGTGIALLILYGILIGVFIIAIKKYY